MNYPSVDKHILGSMKRLFLKPNLAILNDESPEALQDCSAASTIHEFLHAHWPFSGARSLDEYWAENNPMEWVDKVKIRCFLLLMLTSEIGIRNKVNLGVFQFTSQGDSSYPDC